MVADGGGDVTMGGTAARRNLEPPTGVLGASDSWVAGGPTGPNQVYLGNRLSYRDEVDESMSGQVSLTLALDALKRVLLIWFVLLLLTITVSVVLMLVADADEDTVKNLFIFMWIVMAIYPFLPMRLPIKEWHLLVDNRGVHAASAYYFMARMLAHHDAPVRITIRPVRIPNPSEYPNARGNQPRHKLFYVRNYLELVHGRFRGTISAFPYGRDLFVGWTMWWRISPMRIWLSFLGQAIVGAIDPQARFRWIQRSDDIKAFKDLVHAVAREGIDASNYVPSPEAQRFVDMVPAGGLDITDLATL